MINQQIAEFPIIYSLSLGSYGIGWGVHTTVADECKKAGIKKALVVTTGLRGTGIVDEIVKILKHGGIATEVYKKVTSNPKDYEIMEGYEVYKKAECDGIVSVGGGSSHDAGKGIRIVLANDGRHICDFAAYLDWMQKNLTWKPVTIPQIALNTTAGTGAESSGGVMVTNTKLRAKQVCIAPGVIPTIGLTDPLLVRLMPQNMAAWSGWDAFTHCMETFVSSIQVPHSLAICAKGIQMFAENIREFTYNRMNHVACENMCWVESMGGYTVSLGGGAGIVHGLGHHISAISGSHHGHTNAVLTLAGERYNQPACPDKFAEMARLMGVDTRGMTRIQASDRWFDEVERLLADLAIQPNHLHEQFGLQPADLKHIVGLVPNEFTAQGNARGCVPGEWLKVLEGAM
jgi:formaldehyde dismutase / methanol dehydrogenase